MAGAMECGASFADISSCTKEYRPQTGRMEELIIDTGKRVCLVLAKNPAGFNQSVRAVLEDPSEKDVLIGINDYVQDGKDVSWLDFLVKTLKENPTTNRAIIPLIDKEKEYT